MLFWAYLDMKWKYSGHLIITNLAKWANNLQILFGQCSLIWCETSATTWVKCVSVIYYSQFSSLFFIHISTLYLCSTWSTDLLSQPPTSSFCSLWLPDLSRFSSHTSILSSSMACWKGKHLSCRIICKRWCRCTVPYDVTGMIINKYAFQELGYDYVNCSVI